MEKRNSSSSSIWNGVLAPLDLLVQLQQKFGRIGLFYLAWPNLPPLYLYPSSVPCTVLLVFFFFPDDRRPRLFQVPTITTWLAFCEPLFSLYSPLKLCSPIFLDLHTSGWEGRKKRRRENGRQVARLVTRSHSLGDTVGWQSENWELRKKKNDRKVGQ